MTDGPYFRKVFSVGSMRSLAIVLPKKLAKELGIKGGDTVMVFRRGDEIVVKPVSIEDLGGVGK
ncbi:MAG: AbrB/MazE/SpoVT family DNA-binding domain-containing protein [Thermococcus sp.]|nr:AbrB/MazE/SpoVT family DNA-binding domain-containing protein [Thermococcus sp.]